MRLFCELGWHKADPIAPWNNGYYFSRCQRCGRDLVRAAFGGWKVPTGYRVVWRAAPPEQAAAASLAAQPALTVPPKRSRKFPDIGSIVRRWSYSGHTEAESTRNDDKLPIQEVLRHANAHSPGGSSEGLAGRSEFDIYLDDDWGFGDADHAIPAPEPKPESGPAEATAPEPLTPGASPVEQVAVADRPIADVIEASVPIEAEADAVVAPVTEPASSETVPPERFPWDVRDDENDLPERRQSSARARAVSGGAVLLGITALAIAMSVNRVSLPFGVADAPPGARPTESVDGVPMMGEQSAVVTASIINCRSAPNEAAPVVRKMVRGLRVQVLDRQPDWTRVAYRDRQCWLSAPFLASEVPMQAEGA